MSAMTPREIVQELDKHIIGQSAAKRAVAIALRNRWRRSQVDAELRNEITPKNILMIGPTGVGKTEIARRVAQMVEAPFIKVEATKFSEVGYVGRDVESMIRDLVDLAMVEEFQRAQHKVREEAEALVEQQLLDALCQVDPWGEPEQVEAARARRNELVEPLRKGELEETPVTIYVVDGGGGRMDVLSGQGMEEMSIQLKNMFPHQQRAVPKTMPLALARQRLLDDRYKELVDEDEIARDAIHKVQQDGVVFLDELDKVAVAAGRTGGPDVSREGVQRDLLPLVEGTTVRTKYGAVSTDHILFVGAGAFHMAKITDLIPELLGRFPIRVRLRSLEESDLKRILLEPKNSLVLQYEALLETEGVDLTFTDDAADEMARYAARANAGHGDLGARRLHAVVERVLEELLYVAPEGAPSELDIDAAYVRERLGLAADGSGGELDPMTDPVVRTDEEGEGE